MLKRFFAWIGSLMRRRHFVSTVAVVAPAPVVGLPGKLDFSLAANSAFLLLLEDI